MHAVAVRTGMHADKYVDMCVDMCVDMYMDIRMGAYLDIQADMRMGTCIDMHETYVQTRVHTHGTVTSRFPLGGIVIWQLRMLFSTWKSRCANSDGGQPFTGLQHFGHRVPVKTVAMTHGRAWT